MLAAALGAFRLLSTKSKLVFSLIILARIVIQSLDLLGLLLVGFVATMLSSQFSGDGAATYLGFGVPELSDRTLILAVGVGCAFFVGKSILAILLLSATTRFLAVTTADAADEVAQYFFTNGIQNLQSRRKGEVQWLITDSTHMSFSSVLFTVGTVITETALFVAVSVSFFLVDAGVALLLFLFFGFLLGTLQLLVTRPLRKIGTRIANSFANLNSIVLDISTTFKEILVLQRQGRFLDQLYELRRAHAIAKGHERLALSAPRYLVEVSLILAVAGIILWQVLLDNSSGALEVVSVFAVGGTRMLAAMVPLQNALNELRMSAPQALPSQEVISNFRKEKQRVAVPPTLDTPQSLEIGESFDISVKNLSFTYPGSEVHAVRGVELTISHGQFAAIIGPSGAGKSTLAELILGLIPPAEGEIEISGMAPENFRLSNPGLISYVPQRPGLISASLKKNVALGVNDHEIDEQQVARCIEMAGLSKLLDTLDGGLNASLGEGSTSMSAGQIQRLGLARAFYPSPKLLVLDEVTSSLDAESEAWINHGIETFRELGATVLVVAHRLATIQRADVVFVMDKGRIIEAGPFAQVRKTVPMIERYIELTRIAD